MPSRYLDQANSRVISSFTCAHLSSLHLCRNLDVPSLACTFSCNRLSRAVYNNSARDAAYAPIKENKFLHVTIAAAWILVRATIRFRDVLRLDRRGADRRCPSDDQGGGSARTASSHREVPLAWRESRCFLLHFRHLSHREPIVPNHFASDLALGIAPASRTLVGENFAQFDRERFFIAPMTRHGGPKR